MIVSSVQNSSISWLKPADILSSTWGSRISVSFAWIAGSKGEAVAT